MTNIKEKLQKTERLNFNEKKHEYSYGKGKDKVILTGVTTLVGKYFKEFDAKGMARRLAGFKVNKENKRGVRYWLREWKGAAQHGTRVHNAIEDYINGNSMVPDFPEERDSSKFTQAVTWLLNNIDKTDAVKPEMRLFSKKYNVAGTLDLPVFHEDGSVSIEDWKTNKAIKTTPYTKGETGFGICSDLPDCNYSKYALQLSVYAILLEEQTGKEVKSLRIVHLRDTTVVTHLIDMSKYRHYAQAILEENRDGIHN